jgi:GxxExxY protein
LFPLRSTAPNERAIHQTPRPRLTQKEHHEVLEGHAKISKHLSPSLPEGIERIVTITIDAGFKVHKALGPGLLESAYEHCLAHELTKRDLKVERQVAQPVVYDDVMLDVGYRIDLLVNGVIIIEVKSAEATTSTHVAQLLTYLRFSGCHLGFVMNFGTALFKNGVRRVVA